MGSKINLLCHCEVNESDSTYIHSRMSPAVCARVLESVLQLLLANENTQTPVVMSKASTYSMVEYLLFFNTVPISITGIT